MDILQEDCEAVRRALTTGPKLCFVGDEASQPSTWTISLVSGLNRSEVYPFDGGICGWKYARLATLDEVSKYIEPTVERVSTVREVGRMLDISGTTVQDILINHGDI